MKNKYIYAKIITFSLLVAVFFSLSAIPSFATETALPEPPELDGIGAYTFYNVTSDVPIAGNNETLEISTSCSASAKIMTGLLACEKLGNRLDEYVQITSEMLVGVVGNTYNLKAGESVCIRDLMYMAICGSYNDAAYVLAYVIGGSIDEFVTLMNKHAHELGATKTHYTNPIGYPATSSMVTTASNTAKIASAAYENSLYMEICSSVQYSMTDSGNKISNPNNLLNKNSQYYNKKCLGMNVGQSTSWSLITAVSDGNQDYICVILDGTDSKTIYNSANSLISWVYDEYQTINVYKKGKEMGYINVGLTGMASSTATYVTATDLDVYLQKDIAYTEGALTQKIELISDTVNAPIEAGYKVGELKIYYGNRCVGKCDLVVLESFEQNPILSAINKVSEYLHSRAFVISVIVAVVAIPSSIIFVKLKYTRRRYRR